MNGFVQEAPAREATHDNLRKLRQLASLIKVLVTDNVSTIRATRDTAAKDRYGR